MIFKSSVSELVTMFDAGSKVEDDAVVNAFMPLLFSSLIALFSAGGGMDMSTATLRASQFNFSSDDGDSSGRSANSMRSMTVKPFCSHRAMGESFSPAMQYHMK
jgi:hypothetical protein